MHSGSIRGMRILQRLCTTEAAAATAGGVKTGASIAASRLGMALCDCHGSARGWLSRRLLPAEQVLQLAGEVPLNPSLTVCKLAASIVLSQYARMRSDSWHQSESRKAAHSTAKPSECEHLFGSAQAALFARMLCLLCQRSCDEKVRRTR
jgi:hypothetical protein